MTVQLLLALLLQDAYCSLVDCTTSGSCVYVDPVRGVDGSNCGAANATCKSIKGGLNSRFGTFFPWISLLPGVYMGAENCEIPNSLVTRYTLSGFSGVFEAFTVVWSCDYLFQRAPFTTEVSFDIVNVTFLNTSITFFSFVPVAGITFHDSVFVNSNFVLETRMPFVLENCTFDDRASTDNIAIVALDTNLMLTNVSFLGSAVGLDVHGPAASFGAVRLTHVLFDSCDRGLTASDGASLVLTDVRFVGTMALLENAMLNASLVSFDGSTLGLVSSAAWLQRVAIVDACDSDHAVAVLDSSLSVRGLIARENCGNALLLVTSGTVDLRDVVFEYNFIGLVEADSNSDVRIANARVAHTRIVSTYWSALCHFAFDSRLSVANASFYNNTYAPVAYSAASVLWIADGNATFANCSMLRNGIDGSVGAPSIDAATISCQGRAVVTFADSSSLSPLGGSGDAVQCSVSACHLELDSQSKIAGGISTNCTVN